MKHHYTLILPLIAVFSLIAISFAQAQSVNGVPIKDIDVEYIQIVGTSKLFTTKVTIEIDFGQATKYFGRDMQIKDESGKLLVFNSMIDALNFMTANGYEFVQAYAFMISNQSVYHYLLRKKK